jgi:hypothetical protein
MRYRIVFVLTLAVILFTTLSLRCGGYRKQWFRVTCAVARHGAEPGMAVGFQVLKAEQNGELVWDKIVEQTEVTEETGWTPEFICDFEMLYDDRSTEFVEDVRVVATVNDDGSIYKDMAFYTPQIFLNETQSVSLRIDLPAAAAPGGQGPSAKD